jgi:hypothetical protein
VMGAEIVDEWEDGCLIRSEEILPVALGQTYYVKEGDDLVAVTFPVSSASESPFDYAARKDRSDIRPRSALGG